MIWDRICAFLFGFLLYSGLAWQGVAVTLKFCSVLSWSWWMILLPVEIFVGLLLLLVLVLGTVVLLHPPRPFR